MPAAAGPMAAAGIAPPAQAAAVQRIQASPRIAAQRRQLRAMFGPAHVPDDGPVQREAEDAAIKSAEVLDDDEGEYVMVELNGGRVPHAADVADALDDGGLLRERGKDKEKDKDKEREPASLDDIRDAVLDALDRGASGRASQAPLRGMRKAHVQVQAGSGDTPARILIGPLPPGTVDDTEYSAEDLLFSDNAMAAGDHSLITDGVAGER
jgi:hypothetical protein